MQSGSESGLRYWLQSSLAAAMKARDRVAVSALRSALRAIDNATAVRSSGPSFELRRRFWPPTSPASDAGGRLYGFTCQSRRPPATRGWK